MTNASKLRRYRERAANGRAVVSIEIDLVNTEEFLIAANLLAPAERDDRAALARAVERVVKFPARAGK